MDLVLTRHCFHGVMIYSMGVSANQHAVKSRDNTSRCANVIVYYIRIQGSCFQLARGHPNDRRASQSHILAGPFGQP